MNQKHKIAVVTGVTGAVGSALVRFLIRQHYQVFAVVRPDSPRKEQIQCSENLTVIECALSALPLLCTKIQQKCDVFFHLAWAGTFGNIRNDMHLQTENIQAAVTAAETAHRLGCEVFVGAGSQAEYGRKETALTPETPVSPENGYGMAKLCAGQMTRQICDAYGMKHLWFRILSVYGEFDNENSMIMTAVRQFSQQKSPAFTKGEQLWDYLYSEDAARALVLAAERAPASAVYCLGSGQPRKLRDYICTLRDCINPALPAGLGEIPYSENQVMCLYADISALTKDTGFVPAYDFETGIRKTIDWYQKHQNMR